MYDVSILIPTYNRSKLLGMTLETLSLQNSHGLFYEVIIIDDGSTDDTKDMVSAYLDKIQNIKYIYNEHNGFRVAYLRNVGILHAKGKIIIFVDSGMLLCKDYIYEHYKSHSNDKQAVIGNVYGFTADPEDQNFISLIDISDIDQTFNVLKDANEYYDPRIDGYKKFSFNTGKMLAPYSFFWTCNVSVNRQTLVDIGGFDENFRNWGVEDIELAYRLYCKGFTFKINLNAQSIHYPHNIEGNIKSKIDPNRDKVSKLCFHDKFNNIDTELYISGSKDVYYNEDLLYLFQNDNRRYDFSKQTIEEVVGFNISNSILIIGAKNGFIINDPAETVMLEYVQGNYDNLVKMYGNDRIYHRLGTITNFADNSFEWLIITDFWIYLNDLWLTNLLDESLRIAKNIVILYQIKTNGEDRLQFNAKRNPLIAQLNTKKLDYNICISENKDKKFTYLLIKK